MYDEDKGAVVQGPRARLMRNRGEACCTAYAVYFLRLDRTRSPTPIPTALMPQSALAPPLRPGSLSGMGVVAPWVNEKDKGDTVATTSVIMSDPSARVYSVSGPFTMVD